MRFIADIRSSMELTRPEALKNMTNTHWVSDKLKEIDPNIMTFFPQLKESAHLLKQETTTNNIEKPVRIGVLFSGGQASGGHNVIVGLYHAIKEMHPNSTLIGFLDGPKGFMQNSSKEITEKMVQHYQNLGGFDLLGSGRDKIITDKDFKNSLNTCLDKQLNGLVIVGGDDSNTNAAHLAEYLLQNHCQTAVVGVPKTIDGDLKSDDIEISFGFDTATKIYSQIIGDLAKDSLSAKKYTFFIKLMGRSASHVTLECALKTHINLALISEEVKDKNLSFLQVIEEVADVVEARSAIGKDYGIILVPEGLIEFIPEFKQLIEELNRLSGDNLKTLSDTSRQCLTSLPQLIQNQLLMDRDPHGNVQVSKIETERLLIDAVTLELKRRKFQGKFNPQPYFCGYEGRSCLPSFFDAHYCYSLGLVAASLIAHQKTGYMAALKGLNRPMNQWVPYGVPLVSQMVMEERKGEMRPVVVKSLVDLKGDAFIRYDKERKKHILADAYREIGPIQFFGPDDIVQSIPLTIV